MKLKCFISIILLNILIFSLGCSSKENSKDDNVLVYGSPFDPDDHTYKIFTTNGGDNFNKYSNIKIDELFTKARHTDVFEERLKYYKEFQLEMTKDMPIINMTLNEI